MLYKYPGPCLSNIRQNVMSALLNTDNVHLNNWGIEAVCKDIGPMLMDMVVNKRLGNRLFKKLKSN